MARTALAAVRTRKSVPPPKALLVGKTVIRPLAEVKANPWNPNKMTAFERESLKHGFRTDGWIVSQALLIWGKDEKGKVRNLIIDGEHRWDAARELGMPEGPMVFRDGLNEAQAKALTIKLNQKRGRFDEDMLSVVLHDINDTLDIETRSLDLGIPEEELGVYFEEAQPPVSDLPSGQASHVRQIQLFFNQKTHDEFVLLCKELAVRMRTGNVTDTVLETMRRAHGGATQK
jgi:ParB family transcriptional regulator, chromosome partitioning protein